MAFREWIFGENWWSLWLAFTVDFNIILWSRAAVVFIHQVPVDAALEIQVESTSSAAVLSWFSHVKSQLSVNREGKIQFLERAEAREWPSSHFGAIFFYYELTYITKLFKYFLCLWQSELWVVLHLFERCRWMLLPRMFTIQGTSLLWWRMKEHMPALWISSRDFCGSYSDDDTALQTPTHALRIWR